MNLKNWIEENFLNVNIKSNSILFCDDKKFQILESKQEDFGDKKIFDEDFFLIFSQEDAIIYKKENPDYLLFEFGEIWYYSNAKIDDVELNRFLYIGKHKDVKLFQDYSFLGIHSGFELCTGCHLYEDWIKKAKFLNIENLAICEEDSLSGVLNFQLACEKAEVKSIIGETVSVKSKDDNYQLKLFVQGKIGWKNLLNINSQINVFNDGYVTEEFLFDHCDEIICVIPCTVNLTDKFIKLIKKHFKHFYYQLDFVQYSSNEKDKEHLFILQNYFSNFLEKIKPIILCDAYCLESYEVGIKKILNKIAKNKFIYQTKDHYFKSILEINSNFKSLFTIKDLNLKTISSIWKESVFNTNVVSDLCNFKVDTKSIHLPDYEMTKEEKKNFSSNEDLLWDLIESGLINKINIGDFDKEKSEIYYERIEEEMRVIKQGNIVDYFLILWDIIRWCHENNVLVGPGRGSAAGSLVAYCLNITELDPIKYDLLFERFLNEARLGVEYVLTNNFEKINSKEFIEVNDNLKINLLSDLLIRRDNEEIVIKAKDLKINDLIVDY